MAAADGGARGQPRAHHQLEAPRQLHHGREGTAGEGSAVGVAQCRTIAPRDEDAAAHRVPLAPVLRVGQQPHARLPRVQERRDDPPGVIGAWVVHHQDLSYGAPCASSHVRNATTVPAMPRSSL